MFANVRLKLSVFITRQLSDSAMLVYSFCQSDSVRQWPVWYGIVDFNVPLDTVIGQWPVFYQKDCLVDTSF